MLARFVTTWWASPWGVLMVAGLLEVAWALMLPRTKGFSRVVPSAITIALMAASFVLLARAMRSLPAGVAYATWTGIGTLGVAIIGALFFKEAWTPVRVLCLVAIVAGVAGLRLSAKTHL